MRLAFTWASLAAAWASRPGNGNYDHVGFMLIEAAKSTFFTSQGYYASPEEARELVDRLSGGVDL